MKQTTYESSVLSEDNCLDAQSYVVWKAKYGQEAAPPAEVETEATQQNRETAHNVVQTLMTTLQGVVQRKRQIQREIRQQQLQTPILTALESEDAALRVPAEQATRSLLDTLQQIAWKKKSVERTMSLLQRELQQRKRRRIGNIVTTVLGVTALLALDDVLRPAPGFLWASGLILLGIFLMSRASGTRSDNVRTLGEAWDPRAVGVLATAMQEGGPDLKQIASRALRDLLPRVRASDAAFIEAEQMEALLALTYKGDTEIQIALLKALEQIGDARAIPVVESLRNSRCESVREAAQTCLPALQSRIHRTQMSATLLRASGPSPIADGKDELLRPASERDLTSPEQLLRPS